MSRTSTSPQRALFGRIDAMEDTKAAVRSGTYPIAVYGLGKIGLPVAAAFAELTGEVIGMDTDPGIVDTVEAGRAPFDHEPNLDDLVSEVIGDGRMSVTTDGERAASLATIHVIVVPVPLDGSAEGADLRAVESAIETIATGLAPGDIVILESTVPPGTCADLVRPRLAAESDLPSDAFGVASCPERTSSGRALTDIRGAYPRVIGGVDQASTDAAFAVYDSLVDNSVIPVNARTAEAVKLFEGVYRDVNIALANELAKAFDGSGIDVRRAIDAANSQPYCDIHEPGAGVGGHCIPWYPYFLMAAASGEMPLVERARSVNDGMPTYVADRTLNALEQANVPPSEARIAVLGLAYRPEISETAASPTFALVEQLRAHDANVALVDPVVDGRNTSMTLLDLDRVEAFDPHAIVLMTAHQAFEALPWTSLSDRIIIDGRDGIDEIEPNYIIGRTP